ncbi:MAG: BlaI/MecI/CopY family transcriptional regulator [Verrucomicrobia bacterium]|jgi:BlaI family penicillinase repressor|nr:MAG: BlaI/MecI/CopY family transcriptional regulator [Verrucomicrobiota bacterium]
MSTNPPILPSPLELQVLRVLWQMGASTVTAVCDSMMDDKERAYTTVLTVLQNLEKKGLVHREKIGRAHLYEAAYAETQILGPLMEEFVRSNYGGAWHQAVWQMLEQGNLTKKQKSELAEKLLTPTKSRSAATKKVAHKQVAKKAHKGAKKRP